MKILSCDFSKSSKGYNVAMCMFTDECENKIKYMEVFNNDCKLEDIAELIINKFKLLECNYVITDGFGLGITINSILKNKLGCKVKTYHPYALEESKMIRMLYEYKILEELGLELKSCLSGACEFKFNRKQSTDFEYLMVKTIGMANKLLNEIKEESINDNITQDFEFSIEDLSKEFEKLISESYKKMANEYCDKIKGSDINITVNVSGCHDMSEVKEKLLSDLNHALEVIKDIDKIRYI